jgi:hypothetical protein
MFSEDVSCLGAVLIGKPFIIEVMDKTDDSPFLLVLASLPGKVAHYPFNGIGMLSQAIAFIILMKKLQCLLACRYLLSHRPLLSYDSFVYHVLLIRIKLSSIVNILFLFS